MRKKISKLRRELYTLSSVLGDVQALLTFSPSKIVTRLLRKEVQKTSNKINRKIK